MQRITPNLWFNGDAAEGARFYAEVFPQARVGTMTNYPADNLPDFQRDMAGKPLTVDVDLGGFVMTCINAGPEFPITPALSFMLNFASDASGRESLDSMWDALTEGGEALMPLDEYPFSSHYGWVKDRFGVNWQLFTTPPRADARPFIVPSLMFCGPAQNRAAEAREFYRALFDGSELGTVALYEQQTGPAPAGAVMFSDFTLAGQWFAAMDSGAEQPFSFTEGVSLQVACDGQAEIDRLWAALSSVPDAAQCGWCKDRFGVSWQIVPANMGDLMQKPDAYQKLLAMTKIEIADF